MAFCIVGSLAFAQEATKSVAATSTDTMVLRGILIDNSNANDNNSNLADFVKTYTKTIAVKPENMVKGFSIFAEGKRYSFDGPSCGKVTEFLKGASSKIQATVIVKKAINNEVTLISIENQI